MVNDHHDFWLLMYIDPAVGFTAVYMQFFNYFLVEKLFGGNRHFGIGDDQVIVKLTEIFRRGIVKPDELQLKEAQTGRVIEETQIRQLSCLAAMCESERTARLLCEAR